MLNLSTLEIKFNQLRPYLKASVIGFLIVLILSYFIAIVSRVEQDSVFYNYDNIFLFTSYITVMYFSILMAIMITRLVIKPYQKERNIRLLPNICKVLIFISITMMITYLLSILVFGLSESVYQIVPESLVMDTILSALKQMLTLIITLISVGIVALSIGFTKKPMQTTISSSFILITVYGSMIGRLPNHTMNFTAYLLMMGVSLLMLGSLVLRLKKGKVHLYD